MAQRQRVLQAAREIKHRGAVFYKHATWGFPTVRGPMFEPIYRWHQHRHPRPFPRTRYASDWFAAGEAGRSVAAGEPVSRRVFCLWTGANVMSEVRARSLDALRSANPDLDVVLVTPDNLDNWIVEGEPLHASYRNLSLVHRSDYLRAYLLHHHGGGYADVKQPRGAWSPSFDDFERGAGWLAGYTEIHRLLIPLVGGRLEADLRRVSGQLLGYGALIARPHTQLTEMWLQRVEQILDEHQSALADVPGNVGGDNAGYPLGWTQVLASVLAPLTWRFQPWIVHDQRLLPELRNYR